MPWCLPAAQQRLKWHATDECSAIWRGRYLSAAGYLHANVKPFFVALPKVQHKPSSLCAPHNRMLHYVRTRLLFSARCMVWQIGPINL